MTLDECCTYAQEHGFDSVRFSFINLRGEKVLCQWLDAYFEMFKIVGEEGFIRVSFWKQSVTTNFHFTIEP